MRTSVHGSLFILPEEIGCGYRIYTNVLCREGQPSLVGFSLELSTGSFHPEENCTLTIADIREMQADVSAEFDRVVTLMENPNGENDGNAE